MPSTETSASRVLAATDPRDLFGDNPKRARIRYQRLAKELHPDVGGSEEAMRRLNMLWAEYNAGSSDGSRKPREVTRNAKYAVFEEDGGWLVVDRMVGSRAALVNVSELTRILEGTPVCLLDATSSMLIRQKDGPHPAYRATPPDTIRDGVVSLYQLPEKLPNGILHPADAAWMLTRVLFLAAALNRVGLGFACEPSNCLAIAPDTHMLAVIAPWELSLATRGIPQQRALMASFERAIAGMLDLDTRSRKIAKFIRGTVLDGVTESSDLLGEYDDMLYGLFGRPRFHVMECRL